MSPTELIIIITCSFAAGVGATLLGLLIEFSIRKARPEGAEGRVIEAAAEVETPPPQVAEISEEATEEQAAAIAEQVAQALAEAPPVEAPPAEAPPIAEVAAEEVIPPPSEAEAPVQMAPPPAQAAAAPQARVTEQPPAVIGEPELPAEVAALPPVPEPARPSRLGLGLRKTREAFLGRLRALTGGGAKLDEICEGLEEALIGADVGVEASTALVEGVRKQLGKRTDLEGLRDALKEQIAAMLKAVERPPADPTISPLVVMMVGVNGVGKTTTVAKLAARLKEERGGVMVAAADTFRAAAIEQLEVWCKRVGVDLIKQKQGSDPAAVAFDAVKAAKSRSLPTVLIDTAGRLQTKTNLMEELKKIGRVVSREMPGAPHETWLVLDAMTGQNALSQAKIFGEAVPLTGVVLAKLDSSAKGGVIVAIAQRLKLPVRFVGVGEGLEDLRPFDPEEFVESLFSGDETTSRTTSKSYAA